MASAQPDPSTRVEVQLNLGHPTYQTTAETFFGPENWDWWKDLGDLLYGRSGWYCEITNTTGGTDLLWSFGALGSALFVISFDAAPAYRVFDYEADDTHQFASIAELRDWLDLNEPRHAEYPKTMHGYVAPDDWAMLRSFPFSVDVTYDGSSWIATVRKMPVTFSTGSTLADAISNAREAIAAAFDAPASVAPSIKVDARLDQAAVAAL